MSAKKQRILSLEGLEGRDLLAADVGVRFIGPPIHDRPPIVRPPVVRPPVEVPPTANQLAERVLAGLATELGRINTALERVLGTLGDPTAGVPDAVQSVLQAINDKAEHIGAQVADFLEDGEDPAGEGESAAANRHIGGDGRVRGSVIRLEMIARRIGAIDRALAVILDRLSAADAEPSDAVKEKLNAISAAATHTQELVAPYLNTTEDPTGDPADNGGDAAGGAAGGANDGGVNHHPRPGHVVRNPVARHLAGVGAVVHRANAALDRALTAVGEPGSASDAAKAELQTISDNAQKIADTARSLITEVAPAGSAAANGDPATPPAEAVVRHLHAIAIHLGRAGAHLERLAAAIADHPEAVAAAQEALGRIATGAEAIVAKVAPYLADAPAA